MARECRGGERAAARYTIDGRPPTSTALTDAESGVVVAVHTRVASVRPRTIALSRRVKVVAAAASDPNGTVFHAAYPPSLLMLPFPML
jgi:hypothetical protein